MMSEKQIKNQLKESDEPRLRFDMFKPSPADRRATRQAFKAAGIPIGSSRRSY